MLPSFVNDFAKLENFEVLPGLMKSDYRIVPWKKSCLGELANA